MRTELRRKINNFVNMGALFYLNDSGGKDSQAMKIVMARHVPKDQIVTIHAHLPGVEWEGTSEHAQKYAVGHYMEVTATKTFFEMVDHRKMWPSPKNRQCTSDLKRGPIEKAIRHHVKKTSSNVVVNCMGMRAEESAKRAKAQTFKHNVRNSKAGRLWFDMLPIHDLLIDDVFATITNATQEPHWAYKKGMTRLSCCFCIMASKGDLKTAAELNPVLYKKYVEKEKELDVTIMMPSKKHGRLFLNEIIGREV